MEQDLDYSILKLPCYICESTKHISISCQKFIETKKGNIAKQKWVQKQKEIQANHKTEELNDKILKEKEKFQNKFILGAKNLMMNKHQNSDA